MDRQSLVLFHEGFLLQQTLSGTSPVFQYVVCIVLSFALSALQTCPRRTKISAPPICMHFCVQKYLRKCHLQICPFIPDVAHQPRPAKCPHFASLVQYSSCKANSHQNTEQPPKQPPVSFSYFRMLPIRGRHNWSPISMSVKVTKISPNC